MHSYHSKCKDFLDKEHLQIVLSNTCSVTFELLHGNNTSNLRSFNIPGCTAPSLSTPAPRVLPSSRTPLPRGVVLAHTGYQPQATPPHTPGVCDPSPHGTNLSTYWNPQDSPRLTIFVWVLQCEPRSLMNQNWTKDYPPQTPAGGLWTGVLIWCERKEP